MKTKKAIFTPNKLPVIGQRVGVECGPGQYARDNSGIVLSIVNTQWGDYALVLMDDGTTQRCHGLKDGPGIGWHLVK